MRIALLALHFAEYASRLAVALSARHEVLLVLLSRNARSELTDELRGLVEAAVDVRYLEMRRLRDPRVLFTSLPVNRIIREFAPDVLHMQEIHPVLGAGTILALQGSMPLVLTVHDPVSHSGDPPRDGLRWKTLVWLRRRANRLIVHGPRMRSELETLDGRFAGNVDAIPHGLLGGTGVEHDIGGGEPATFLFFGRIEPYKGLRYLLDAGEILRARGQAARLIVAGTGTDLQQHRTRIRAHAWIELMDRHIAPAEVAGLFRRSMAVVLPYTDATQSGVAAMALANARPVIAAAVGDLPDVVIDGRTGLLVPPRDAGALADAMERLLLDPGLRDSLAAGASQYAARELSWPRIAELTEGTYRRAIESRIRLSRDRRRHAAPCAQTRRAGTSSTPRPSTAENQ